jgi:hypothetical protein
MCFPRQQKSRPFTPTYSSSSNNLSPLQKHNNTINKRRTGSHQLPLLFSTEANSGHVFLKSALSSHTSAYSKDRPGDLNARAPGPASYSDYHGFEKQYFHNNHSSVNSPSSPSVSGFIQNPERNTNLSHRSSARMSRLSSAQRKLMLLPCRGLYNENAGSDDAQLAATEKEFYHNYGKHLDDENLMRLLLEQQQADEQARGFLNRAQREQLQNTLNGTGTETTTKVINSNNSSLPQLQQPTSSPSHKIVGNRAFIEQMHYEDAETVRERLDADQAFFDSVERMIDQGKTRNEVEMTNRRRRKKYLVYK